MWPPSSPYAALARTTIASAFQRMIDVMRSSMREVARIRRLLLERNRVLVGRVRRHVGDDAEVLRLLLELLEQVQRRAPCRRRARPRRAPRAIRGSRRIGVVIESIRAVFAWRAGIPLPSVAESDARRRFVDRNVAPFDRLAARDAPHELHAMRKSQRQPAERQRVRGRHQLAVDGVAALAVEQSRLRKVALCRGDDVRAPRARHAGRLARAAPRTRR